MGKRQVRRQDKRIKNQGLRDFLIAAFVVLCAVYIIACTMPREGIIINRTYVNHVDVSGLTQEQAALRIQQDFEKSYAHQSLTVEAAGNKYSVLINNSLEIDAKGAAKRAYEYSHGSFITRGFGVLKAAVFTQHFSWNAHISDEAALKTAVEKSGLSDLNTTTQTTYEIKGDELVFKKGKVGYSVDQPALIEKLKAAVKADDYVSVIDSPMKQGTVEATDMAQVHKKVFSKKRNATLDPDHDYDIVKSRHGIDFDVASAREAFDAAEEGGQVVIPLDIDKAEVTTDDLKKNLFKDVLGETTMDLVGSGSRISNVELAADNINGTILLAGQSFSFNKCLGERTEEKGYKRAYAYSSGLTSGEVGGGIGQVSSALYQAVLLANLKVDKHQNHTYVTDYTEAGLDAAVSWEEPDFCFTNNTKYPVRIDAVSEDGQLKVNIAGANPKGIHVEISTEIIKVIDHDTIYQEDHEMFIGESTVISYGVDGCNVQTYRKIYDKNNKLISEKKEAYCEYKSSSTIIREGTKEPETTQESTETAPAEDTSKKIDGNQNP